MRESMPDVRAAGMRAARRATYRAWLLRTHPAERVALRGRALHPYRARQFGAFGPGSYVHRPAWLYGTHQMSVGARVRVMAGAWLSVEPQGWTAPGPVLVLGDDVAIRGGVTISAAQSVVIEEAVGIAGGVTIVDSRHTWSPDDPNVMHGPLETAPVRIGRGSWLAEHVVITAGADVGERCAIGPNAVVSGTVPDFSVVVGNPGRVVGRTDR